MGFSTEEKQACVDALGRHLRKIRWLQNRVSDAPESLSEARLRELVHERDVSLETTLQIIRTAILKEQTRRGVFPIE